MDHVCAQATPETGPQQETRGAVRIGPEDTVTILALNVEEISKAWRVGANGSVNLPMVGQVQAGGLTVSQLETELTTRLKRFVHNPEVTVYVSEFRSQPVTVTGAVAKPGVIQLEGARTLFDVLMLAGGPKDAGPSVTLTRGVEHGAIPFPGAVQDSAGTYSFVEFELKDVMAGRGENAVCEVMPYDVVSVSTARPQRYVHISGEVNRPGSVELVNQDTVSLMKVLAVAGGVKNTAGGRAMIMHINAEGSQTSTAFVELKKITTGNAKDLDLSAGDVVVVPTSQWKTYLQVASSAAITTGMYVLARF